MKRSKIIFLICCVIFFIVIGYIAFDFSRKTTFPGSKPPLKKEDVDSIKMEDPLRNDTSVERP